MDSFELNKIIGAVLLVALLVIGIGKVSNLVFKVNKPEKAGYKVVGNLVLVDLKYVQRVDNFNLDVRSVIQYG